MNASVYLYFIGKSKRKALESGMCWDNYEDADEWRYENAMDDYNIYSADVIVTKEMLTKN